jgi:thioredoxin 2
MRQFLCQSCGAANRIPDDKNALAAKCGRCGEPLRLAHPVEVDAKAFHAHHALTKGAAVLVDVWAPWCGPCRAMAPQFTAAATRLEPDARLLKLNSEVEPGLAAELGVSGIPALLLFKDGRLLDRTAGLMSADQIVAWTRQALARAPARAASKA